MIFQIGDRVEWIPATNYRGTVTEIKIGLLGVLWDAINDDPPTYAEHPINKHRFIGKDTEFDQYEIDCD